MLLKIIIKKKLISATLQFCKVNELSTVQLVSIKIIVWRVASSIADFSTLQVTEHLEVLKPAVMLTQA